MDIIEAINARHSVRAFKPDPVPRKVLEEILTVAQRAPSWANTQTWEFIVVGGSVMKELAKTLADKAFAQDERKPDIPWPEWPSPYKERRKENGVRLYETLGIKREDIERQLNWFVGMYRFFDAPNGIFICVERNLPAWAIMNVGLVAQNINLAALDYGLGSIMLAAGICYPDAVRRVLKIPDSKELVIAFGIGYPDNDAAINKFRTHRVPFEEVCTWQGF